MPHPTRTTPAPAGPVRRRLDGTARLVAACGVVALILAGCSADTTTSTDPADAGSDVAEDVAANSDLGAMLDELPVPPGAQMEGDPTVDGQTIEQTWTIQGQDVESVFNEVYEPELEAQGWTMTDQLAEEGTGWSGSWERDGTSLTIVSEAGQDTTDITTDVLLTAPEPLG